MKPRVLVLRAAGTNCDLETLHAFELAGADVDLVHVNRLIDTPSTLDAYQIFAISGGFSYGDDIAAGRILANQLMLRLGESLHKFVSSGKPVIGICNGFQVLVKTDILPGPAAGLTGQVATLAHNDRGRFIDKWVTLQPQPGKCIWTRDLSEIELPIAHGEGRFMTQTDQVRQDLWSDGRVALTYSGENPNGSTDAIAGICDPTGLVFGLMPHPERHVSSLQYYNNRAQNNVPAPGLKVFANGVAMVT